MTSPDASLIRRFAIASLVAFTLTAVMLSALISGQTRRNAERAAIDHAVFLAETTLQVALERVPSLIGPDLGEPLMPGTDHHAYLARETGEHILLSPVVRMKIWRDDGTILFSDEPALIGKRFEPGEDLVRAFEGEVVAHATRLEEPEARTGRELGRKLLGTYVPLREGGRRDAGVVAVVELYQDYQRVEEKVREILVVLLATLLAGLAALYLLLFSISRRLARTLSQQNARLVEQATRLKQALRNEQRALRAEQQTVAKLRELNRVKDEFTAVASHELRTPLTSIIGYAKTLQRPQFADDAATRVEFLQAIERQGQRLFRLLQNLLATSSIEGEHTRLNLKRVSFHDIARDVIAGLGGNRGRVQLKAQSQLPPMITDRQRLELVLANLVDNAIKFSAEDRACDLGAGLEGERIRIWVRDRGIGIPADKIDKVFDRFYQTDSSATRQYGGVGLGLSLVKDLVESLGGHITVTSQAHTGSVFAVTLPVVHPSVTDPEEFDRPDPQADWLADGGREMAAFHS